jgi:hypothetical protein
MGPFGILDVMITTDKYMSATANNSMYKLQTNYINKYSVPKESDQHIRAIDTPSHSTTAANMPILHIVLFEFKPTTTHAQVEDVRRRTTPTS